MRKIIITGIIFSLLFAAINVEAQTKKVVTPKPLKGKIVSLDDITKGVPTKNLQLTKSRANELYESKSPLVFLYNKKVYFVQNEDGSFAFKKLADYAHNNNVGIIGKTKTTTGINVIIMSNIESMD